MEKKLNVFVVAHPSIGAKNVREHLKKANFKASFPSQKNEAHTVFCSPLKVENFIDELVQNRHIVSLNSHFFRGVSEELPESIKEFSDMTELIQQLTETTQWYEAIDNIIEVYRDTWNGFITKRDLRIIAKVITNYEPFKPFLMRIEKLVKKTILRCCQKDIYNGWNVNGSGPKVENNVDPSAFKIEIHLMKSNFIVMYQILDWHYFQPSLQTTNRYGSSYYHIVAAADVGENMLVLDLNAGHCETLIELFYTKNCFCIGLIQNEEEAEYGLENIKCYQKLKKKNVFFDLICAEMKDFLNFFIFDRIFGRCNFPKNTPVNVLNEYYSNFRSILNRCRPNITAVLTLPHCAKHKSVIESVFSLTLLQTYRIYEVEEYHKKSYVLVVQTGIST